MKKIKMYKIRWIGVTVLVCLSSFSCAKEVQVSDYLSLQATNTTNAGNTVETQQQTWRTIIAFKTGVDLLEDWNYIYFDVKTEAEKKGITMKYYDSHLNRVPIGPANNPVAYVDLSLFKGHELGFVFFEPGKIPRFQEYGQTTEILRAASKYFSITLE